MSSRCRSFHQRRKAFRSRRITALVEEKKVKRAIYALNLDPSSLDFRFPR